MLKKYSGERIDKFEQALRKDEKVPFIKFFRTMQTSACLVYKTMGLMETNSNIPCPDHSLYIESFVVPFFENFECLTIMQLLLRG